MAADAMSETAKEVFILRVLFLMDMHTSVLLTQAGQVPVLGWPDVVVSSSGRFRAERGRGSVVRLLVR